MPLIVISSSLALNASVYSLHCWVAVRHRYVHVCVNMCPIADRTSCRYFWWVVRQDCRRQKVVREDMLVALEGNTANADFAFGLFDLNGDGFVLEGEVHARLQKIYRCVHSRLRSGIAVACLHGQLHVCTGYLQACTSRASFRSRYTSHSTPPQRRQRRAVAITLANTEVVLSTLSTVVGCILHAGAAFAYPYIFGADVRHLVLSLSSTTLAFAFVFGENLKRIYESVVFLFVVRPYVVGDWLLYKARSGRVVRAREHATQTAASCGDCMLAGRSCHSLHLRKICGVRP